MNLNQEVTNYINKASTNQVEILEILRNLKDKKKAFVQIRQIIADSKVRDFQPLFTFLYDNIDEYGTGHVAGIILILADAQYKDAHAVDKEINIMAMFVGIMNEL